MHYQLRIILYLCTKIAKSSCTHYVNSSGEAVFERERERERQQKFKLNLNVNVNENVN